VHGVVEGGAQSGQGQLPGPRGEPGARLAAAAAAGGEHPVHQVLHVRGGELLQRDRAEPVDHRAQHVGVVAHGHGFLAPGRRAQVLAQDLAGGHLAGQRVLAAVDLVLEAGQFGRDLPAGVAA
jgi:hypothetical protein